ncbi:MAG: hypothetical protein M1825_000949 [Sarcosagium campestre]|nr:MAG: hypothetical protein M1825_000949 [Sarcosagium campestre]
MTVQVEDQLLLNHSLPEVPTAAPEKVLDQAYVKYQKRSPCAASDSQATLVTLNKSHEVEVSYRSLAPSVHSNEDKGSLLSFMGSKKASLRDKLTAKFTGQSIPKSSECTKRKDQMMQPRDIRGLHANAIKPRLDTNTASTKPRSQASETPRPLEQAVSVKRWVGGGIAPHAWGKLRQDPELWDASGDTLVYFGAQRPQASFRIQSSILKETGSEFFISLLREGYKHKNDSNSSSSDLSISSRPSRDGTSKSSFSGLRPRAATSIESTHARSNQFSSTFSEATTVIEDSPILYEIFFPAPKDASKQNILRHYITTRNVLALLKNKSLVGLNFFQALIDLHQRLQVYMPADTDCSKLIKDYLVANQLDDVRNDPVAASGLLSWSEEPTVRWSKGWREGFVHCVGMFDRLYTSPELRDVSAVTRVLLERAAAGLQDEIQKAESKLSAFKFDDFWPTQSAGQSAARVSYDRFRKFLKNYYETFYKGWPVRGAKENGAGWLDRGLALRLQTDFGALYDHFVDRDLAWDASDDRTGHKIISKTQRSDFRADTDLLPVTTLLRSFDSRHGYPHIPHPYPLLPTSAPIQSGFKSTLFNPAKRREAEKKAVTSYVEASNTFVLGAYFADNELVDAFIRFEKSDQIGEINPLDARMGRWFLLYCILQALAGMTIDSPGLEYTDDVDYFLNPCMEGTPPWETDPESTFQQSSHLDSYCWKAEERWAVENTFGISGIRKHCQIVVKSDEVTSTSGFDPTYAGDGMHTDFDRVQSPWTGVIEVGRAKPRQAPRHVPLLSVSRLSEDKKKPNQTSPDRVGLLRRNSTHGIGQSHYTAPEGW